MASDGRIAIIPAEESDIPAMISVHLASMDHEVLTNFNYGPNRAEGIQRWIESMSTMLPKRFQDREDGITYIYKAVDTQDSNKLIAWTLARRENGAEIEVPEKKDVETFRETYKRQVMGKYKEVVGDREHVCLGALYVDPAWHGQGIGRRLVEHLYKEHDLAKEPVVVQTRAGTEKFYKKMGWKTIVAAETDLSEWAGKGMGFGVHRSPQMLRGEWK